MKLYKDYLKESILFSLNDKFLSSSNALGLRKKLL